MATVKTVRGCAVCVRISMFILNGLIWVGALLAIVCGLMIGISNGTFSLDASEDDNYDGGEIRWKDVLYTTPATILVYYGVLMLITAMMGCFAVAGGKRFWNAAYAISILIIMLFDLLFGYIFFWNPYAMQNFISGLNKSMDGYGIESSSGFGIFPRHPTEYWDQLQRTGSCCGKFSSEEWREKKIGSEEYNYSLPDSCCTKDYDYRNCGWRIWQHMEGDMDHYRSQMLKRVGCVSIFPEEVTTKYHEISYIVVILGLFLVICGILALVLLSLINSKKYRTGQGPQERPHFARDLKLHDADRVSAVTAQQSEKDGSKRSSNPYATPRFFSGSEPASYNEKTEQSTRRHSFSTRHRVHPSEKRRSTLRDTRRRSTYESSRAPTRSILRKDRVSSTSTHNLYINDGFGSTSGIEEFPVVYRRQAEDQLMDDEFGTTRGHRNRPISK